MHKSKSSALCFIVASACLLSAFGTFAKEERNGNGKLWSKVWESIQANNGKMGGDKLKSSADQWLQLLQKHLDMDSSPHNSNAKEESHVTKTSTTPGTGSSTSVEIDVLLGFLKENGVTLSNEQRASLLRYVLSANKAKAQSPATTPSATAATTVPTTTTTITSTTRITTPSTPKATTEVIVDEYNWLQNLQRALDNNEDISMKNKDKLVNILKATDKPLPTAAKFSHGVDNKDVISEEQWDHLLLNMETEMEKTNKGKNLVTSRLVSTTTPPRLTTTSKSSLDGKKKIYITNEQWDALLERAFLSSDSNGRLDLNVKTTESPKKSTKGVGLDDELARQNSVVSDKEWDRALQDMVSDISEHHTVDGAVSGEKAQPVTATKSLQTTLKKASTTEPHVDADKQWEYILENAFKGNSDSKDVNFVKKTTSSPELKTTHGGRVVLGDTLTRQNGVVSDKEWDRALQGMVSDISEHHTVDGAVSGQKAQLVTATKSLQTTSKKASTTEPHVDADKQWEYILENAFKGNSNSKDVNSVKKASSPKLKTTHGGRVVLGDEGLDAEWKNVQASLDMNWEFRDASIDKNTATPTTRNNAPRTVDVFDKNEVQEVLDTDKHLKNSNVMKTSPSTNPQALATHKYATDRNSEWENGQQRSDKELEEQIKAAFGTGPLKPSSRPITHITKPKSSTDNTAVNTDSEITTDGRRKKLLNGDLNIDEAKASSDKIRPATEAAQTAAGADSSLGSHSTGAFSNNFYMVLLSGIVSGVLLVIIVASVVLVVCRIKRKVWWAKKDDMHTTILNADGNRWNPQALRPSKENINAFLYSIPTPMKEVKIDY